MVISYFSWSISFRVVFFYPPILSVNELSLQFPLLYIYPNEADCCIAASVGNPIYVTTGGC